jgi:glycine/betaine/sarcosine/D-proline reductase family selenoprotein B
MTPVALMVGSNRVIPAGGIAHPLGSPDLDPKGEKALRRRIVKKALESLQKDVKEQTLFAAN